MKRGRTDIKEVFMEINSTPTHPPKGCGAGGGSET